ncbi:MAG: hypothetical protein ACRD50_16605 [Candidatus Acidiferrales bacterium]
MPNYNAQNPPYAIFPGDVALAFNNENPSAPQSSQQFAMPDYSGRGEQGRTVRWQTIFGSAPTAVNIQLQGALDDVDAHYQTIDTSTATAGEARTVTGVNVKFLRVKLTSITAGSGITVQLLA